jgi:hypothetical protein
LVEVWRVTIRVGKQNEPMYSSSVHNPSSFALEATDRVAVGIVRANNYYFLLAISRKKVLYDVRAIGMRNGLYATRSPCKRIIRRRPSRTVVNQGDLVETLKL